MDLRDFLQDRPGPRPWSLAEAEAEALEPVEYFLGGGDPPLEVAVAHSAQGPSRGILRKVWKARHGNAASPLLLVVLWNQGAEARASLCGPVGDDPPIYDDLDASQAERIARTALEEPDRHAAVRLLRSTLPETESELAGLRNVGMFAAYHLRERVPARADWQAMGERGRALLPKRGRDLIEGLGFEIESRGATTHVLRIRENGQASAVAIFLDDNENPEKLSGRFRESTPVTTALAKATAENLRYVVLTRGREIRLYGTSPEIGVGRKGRAETFVEANLALLPAESAAYLPLVFSADALRPGGSFEDLLNGSRDFAAAIGERLRDRVYDHVVPDLALAIGRAQVAAAGGRLDARLDEIYETAMVVLFRLLFVAYAEDKGLLPYETNERYREHSLKALARSMAESANRDDLRFPSGALTLWHRVEELWRAVDRGRDEWGVPTYNGGLFSPDPQKSPVGAKIAELQLEDPVIGPVLFHLLVDPTEAQVHGPVDFAALSVREFGTIYEGLLESSLAVAREPLRRDANGRYAPSCDEQQEIGAGEIFLQGNDGARKATGSYFTPHFAVEHLLDRALEPALRRHLDRIEKLIHEGHEGRAARELFNFRVADIAMGSGHFLVAAVDRIEAMVSDFLERHPLPGVTAELERLRKTAQDELGGWGGQDIERASLLRRQIARRCIYGVDINRVAVDLARVSLWIHTFVEGLPLSFLDRTLVHGDSLFGAANADEARALLAPDAAAQDDLFSDLARRHVEAVRADLDRLAQSSDATDREIEGAREAFEHVRAKLQPLRETLDIAVASTVDLGLRSEWGDHVDRLLQDDVFRRRILKKAEPKLLSPRSIHFPLEFPEVFYRDAAGFDCVIGNPPWEEVTVEHDRFWLPYIPGLQSLGEAEKADRIRAMEETRPDLVERHHAGRAQAERIRAFLTTGRFPGMGRGDPDLYKAFSWRFLAIVANQVGGIGVVVPRSLFQAAGSADFRAQVLTGRWHIELCTLENTGGWVFQDVEPRYSLILATLIAAENGLLLLDGPHRSLAQYNARVPAEVPAASVSDWSPTVTMPLLPGSRSGRVLEKLMAAPPIGSADRADFEVRPVRESDATNDRVDRNPRAGIIVIAESCPAGHVPVHGGEAIDLWTYHPERAYGWADPEHANQVLFDKRRRQANNRRSAFYGLSPEVVDDPGTLPSRHPRVAFRDVTRATDSRTMRVGVVPGGVYLTNAAPYLLFVRGDAPVLAYLLGTLSSRPFDWTTRRYVELHMNFYLFNNFRVPEHDRGDPLARRVVELAGALSCQSASLEDWARTLGRQVVPLSPEQHADHEAELDAVVGHLYGLDEGDLTHVMETFHTGWNHESHLEAVLEHYHRWASEREEVGAGS